MTTEINLLPPNLYRGYLLKRSLVFWVTRLAPYLIAALEIISLGALVITAQTYLNLDRVEKEAQTAVGAWEKLQVTEDRIRLFQQKSVALREIGTKSRLFGGLLKTLAELIPESVAYSSLQISGSTIKLTARTGSVSGLSGLISNLLGSNKFKEVILTESEYIPAVQSYQMNLEIPVIAEAVFH